MTRLYLVLSGGLSGEERRSTSEKHSALEAFFEALFFPIDGPLCSGSQIKLLPFKCKIL